MTLLHQVQDYFKANRTHPKKQLGQHFLINANVLDIILDIAEVTDADVLEIGAGLGFLTAALAMNAKSVIAIEIDPFLHAELESQFADHQHVKTIQADILEVDLQTIIPADTHPKIVANLPYGITTPILWKLLNHTDLVSECILMMQREVAERIVATPGGKAYGALTIGVSYRAKTELMAILPPDNFYPAPKVDSALLRLKLHNEPKIFVNDEDYFFRVVKEAFRGRRKMLKNSLRRFTSAERLRAVLSELNIAPQRRAETLSISEFAELANILQSDV